MLQLKLVEEKDKLLIETIYRTTREDELNLTNWPESQKQAFVSMQSTAQLAEYKKNYPGASYQIIIWKRKPAGSGTLFPMSKSNWCWKLPWIIRSSHPENWPAGLRMNKGCLSQSQAFIVFSKQEVWSLHQLIFCWVPQMSSAIKQLLYIRCGKPILPTSKCWAGAGIISPPSWMIIAAL